VPAQEQYREARVRVKDAWIAGAPAVLSASRLRKIQSHCIVHEKMAEHLGGSGVPEPYPPIDINNIVMCEAPEEYQVD